jgi:predicted acyl esterase
MSGYQLMVASDVFRGRYRQSFSTPKAVTPNKIEAYQIDLHQLNHRFRKGHRIMVQIQSTWFPVIDRNPQLYVDNIFKARDSDYISATAANLPFKALSDPPCRPGWPLTV